MAHLLFKPLLIASITSSSILTGCLLSLSYVSVTAILNAPGVAEGHMLTMWRTVFKRGFYLCPSQAILSGSLCFLNAFLTWRFEAGSVGLEKGSSSRVYLLLVAGAFMIGIVPFTLSMIVPLEEILLAKETKLAKAQDQAAEHTKGMNCKSESLKGEESAMETRRQLNRWALLNYGRTILPLVGALVAWSIW